VFFFEPNRDPSKQPKSSPKARAPRNGGKGRFRPQLESLEDRALPSGNPWFFFSPPTVGPATSLEVIVPPQTQIGIPAYVKVIALTASNQQAFNYTGVIHFTSSDSGATLPADFTFGPRDFGQATFKATFATLGPQSLTATDTVTPSITGSAVTQVNPAPVATHFLVVTRGEAVTGQQFTFTVTALDSSNHKVPNYTGTVHFTSSDTAAVLPGDAVLTSGTGKFTVTLNTIGAQTITATDTATSSLKGTATVQVSAPGVATHFAVFAERSSHGSSTFDVFVVALDANNKLATGYAGSVHFTSSDTGATLPPDSTLTGGIGKFTVTLATHGKQTITVTDTVNSALTGTATVYFASHQHYGWFGYHDDD